MPTARPLAFAAILGGISAILGAFPSAALIGLVTLIAALTVLLPLSQ